MSPAARIPVRAVVAALLAGTPLHAATYYVATNGVDQPGGGSLTQPFRTIYYAIQRATQPGDTVMVRAGVYQPPAWGLGLGFSGGPGAPITLRSYPGETATVDGGSANPDTSVIVIAASHVTVSGLEIRNAKRMGVSIWGPGSLVHDVTIENCIVHDCRMNGIFAGWSTRADPVRDVIIQDNLIYDCVLLNQNPPHTAWSFGCGAGNARRVSISGNAVYRCYGEAIGFYLCDSGLVVGNTIHDGFSVNVYLDNTTDTLVAGNLIYSTGDSAFFRDGFPAHGITIANEFYGESNPCARNTMVNNILIDNKTAFYAGSYQAGGGLQDTLFAHNTACGSVAGMVVIDGDAGHANAVLANNIFYQTTGADLTWIGTPYAGLSFHHNAWYGGNMWPPAFGVGDVCDDPQLAAAGAWEPAAYRLCPESPAIDAGADLGAVTTDFAGVPRTAPREIGAFEYAVVGGDLNCDAAVGGADLALFVGCMQGPEQGNQGCDPSVFNRADVEGDGDVDLHDFRPLQAAVSVP